MLKKFDYCKLFLGNDKLLICPKCKKKLKLDNHFLICENKHTYDISKKGTVMLVSNNHVKESKIYNYDLFFYRRLFTQKLFYKKLYEKIGNIVNDFFKGDITILDLGCGEGTHTVNILNLLKCKYFYYGFDYSKVAIDMASDYNGDCRFYFVSDVNDIPIKDNSTNLILDILSPYNKGEVNRLLKDNGLFIKVSPGENYLKELREVLGISLYDKEADVEENLNKNFNNVKKERILQTYKINEEEFNYLLNMTPIENKCVKMIPDKVTIDLIIYIVKKF